MLTAWWESVKDNKHASRMTDIIQRFNIVLAVTSGVEVVDAGLMGIGIQFGNHVLACRERYNPEDSVSNVQAFEHRIQKCFQKYGDMTPRALHRRIHPNLHPGGLVAYYVALRATQAETLVVKKVVGKIQTWGLAW
jgi:hypothetical protein